MNFLSLPLVETDPGWMSLRWSGILVDGEERRDEGGGKREEGGRSGIITMHMMHTG